MAASTTTCSAKPPVPVPAATWSPAVQSVTSAPTAATVPETSPPGVERQRRLELVEVLDHQDVGEVDAAGVDVDDDLVRPRLGIGDLLDDEVLGRPVGVQDGARIGAVNRSATRSRHPEPGRRSISSSIDGTGVPQRRIPCSSAR